MAIALYKNVVEFLLRRRVFDLGRAGIFVGGSQQRLMLRLFLLFQVRRLVDAVLGWYPSRSAVRASFCDPLFFSFRSDLDLLAATSFLPFC